MYRKFRSLVVSVDHLEKFCMVYRFFDTLFIFIKMKESRFGDG